MMKNLEYSISLDIIEVHILPRLPVKSLMRFKCVSKSFLTWISTQEIISLHDKLNNNSCLFVPGHDCLLQSFNFDSSHVKVKFPLSQIVNDDTGNVYVIGSCHGVICLGLQNFNRIILVSPSTRTFKQVPPHPAMPLEPGKVFRVGYGFDDVNQDYKLVSLYKLAPAEYVAFVYTLNTNTWKRIIDSDDSLSSQFWRIRMSHDLTWEPYLSDSLEAVVVNDHLLHWFEWEYAANHDVVYRIDCFDLHTELWTKVPLPKIFSAFSELQMQTIEGNLCLMAELWDEGLIEIWIMKEYGVKDSWVLLCCLSEFPNPSDGSKIDKISPIASWNDRRIERVSLVAFRDEEILFCQHDCPKFFWYNIRENSFTEVHIHGVPPDRFSLACLYKESLVALPGSSQLALCSAQ